MTLNGLKIGLRRPETLDEKQSITLADMQKLLGETAVQVNSAYVRLSRLVYQNPFGLTPAEVTAVLTEAESIELRKQAILIRTLINTLLPGTITDAIPEATITWPDPLFPEA